MSRTIFCIRIATLLLGMLGLPAAAPANDLWIDTYVFPALRNSNKMSANYFLRGFGPQYKGVLANGLWQGGNTYIIPYDPSNGTVSYGNIFYFN